MWRKKEVEFKAERFFWWMMVALIWFAALLVYAQFFPYTLHWKLGLILSVGYYIICAFLLNIHRAEPTSMTICVEDD